MLRMTPGRPLLTITYLRSLTELQPFFNTLCLANQTDNLTMAAKQLVPSKTGKHTVMTNGHPEQHQRPGSYLETKDSRAKGLPKSKSTPTFPVVQQNKGDNTGGEMKTNKQVIEEIILKDFLEPMT